jgi:hypothetical protein
MPLCTPHVCVIPAQAGNQKREAVAEKFFNLLTRLSRGKST